MDTKPKGEIFHLSPVFPTRLSTSKLAPLYKVDAFVLVCTSVSTYLPVRNTYIPVDNNHTLMLH